MAPSMKYILGVHHKSVVVEMYKVCDMQFGEAMNFDEVDEQKGIAQPNTR